MRKLKRWHSQNTALAVVLGIRVVKFALSKPEKTRLQLTGDSLPEIVLLVGKDVYATESNSTFSKLSVKFKGEDLEISVR